MLALLAGAFGGTEKERGDDLYCLKVPTRRLARSRHPSEGSLFGRRTGQRFLGGRQGMTELLAIPKPN